MSIKIMGIDPGSQVVGFGILSVETGNTPETLRHLGHGTLTLNRAQSFPMRLGEIGKNLRQVIEAYRPQMIVVESIFLGKNVQSAFKLGHARGVILAEAVICGCQVFEYPTRLVKKGVTGSGAAEKDHVRQVLQLLLNLREIESSDASDALAMAYFHGLEIQKKRLYSHMTGV